MKLTLVNNSSSIVILKDISYFIDPHDELEFEDASLIKVILASQTISNLLQSSTLSVKIDGNEIDYSTYIENVESGSYKQTNSIVVSNIMPPIAEGKPWFNKIDGIVYIYDESRGKWLSISRSTFCYSLNKSTRKSYLYASTGARNTNTSNLIIRDLTITALSVKYKPQNNRWPHASIHIRSNYNNVFSFDIEDEGDPTSSIYQNLDIDISKETNLQVYLSSYRKCKDPYITLEYAWRSS